MLSSQRGELNNENTAEPTTSEHATVSGTTPTDATGDIIDRGSTSDSSVKSTEAVKDSDADMNDKTRAEKRKEKKERGHKKECS